MPKRKVASRVTSDQADRDAAIQAIIGGDVPEETVRPWAVQGWSKEMIDVWSTGPDREEFLAYCESQGVSVGAAKPKQTTLSDVSPGGFRPDDLEQIYNEVINRIQAGQALAMPAMQAKDDLVLVEFPEPAKAAIEHPDGGTRKIQLALEPINIGGVLFRSNGFYKPDIAQRLQEEVDGAAVVKIPRNAAFVTHTTTLMDADGRPSQKTEHYVGPVFAGKALAKSLKGQVKSLVRVEMPSGQIPGSQTRYADFSTNGINFQAGFAYLVPPEVRDDLMDRIRRHEEAFVKLNQFTDYTPQSSTSGHVLDAREAHRRSQRSGYDPGRAAVESAVPDGTI